MAIGKRNKISLNLCDYNFILLGESGIGKSQTMNKICKTIVGEDGYLFVEPGNERGTDCINDAPYVNCSTWVDEYDEELNDCGFQTLVDDIVANKKTEYPNLKILVIDTINALVEIGEKEIIRQDNKERRIAGKAPIANINEAKSGYGRGQTATIDLIKKAEADLLKVGVRVWKISHVKQKQLTDIFTENSYQQLTSQLEQRYFSAFKDEAHFMALCYFDREFEKSKRNGLESTKIGSESRRVMWRSNDYVVDCKCRFENIAEECALDADEIIKVMTDAIKNEGIKSGKSIVELEKEQKIVDKKKAERIEHNIDAAKVDKELQETIDNIMNFINENRSNLDTLKPIMKEVKGMGYENPKSIDKLEDAKKILEMCK